jgi:hypothetical protein
LIISLPHKGGADLAQPQDEDELWEIEMTNLKKVAKTNANEKKLNEQSKERAVDTSKFPILKLVRKIWEK